VIFQEVVMSLPQLVQYLGLYMVTGEDCRVVSFASCFTEKNFFAGVGFSFLISLGFGLAFCTLCEVLVWLLTLDVLLLLSLRLDALVAGIEWQKLQSLHMLLAVLVPMGRLSPEWPQVLVVKSSTWL
jgi:hypothetical protein